MALALADILDVTTTPEVFTDTATRTFNLAETGVSAGDMMVLCLVINQGGADVGDVLTDPTGWTQIFTQSISAASGPRMYAFWREVPGGGLGATVDITSSVTAISHGGVAFAVTGADVTALDVIGTPSTATSTTITCPAVTATGTGGLTIRMGGNDDDDQASQPAMTSHTSEGFVQVGATVQNGFNCYVWSALQPSTSVGSSTATILSEENAGQTFVIAEGVSEGITDVVPDEFDFDNTDVDIDGLNFEASQGTGAVYISDASTLAGSVNEVEIDGAINTWADTVVNLNFSNLSQGEIDDLHTLGPSATRWIILTNNSADEYSFPIILHRPQAIEMVLGAATPGITTSRLTGMSGTFGGGRIEETAAQNPSTTNTNVVADGNREDVGSMQGKSAARDGPYNFRLRYGSSLADTVTTTPQVTFSSGLATSGQLVLPSLTINGVADTEYFAAGQPELPQLIIGGTALAAYDANGQAILPALTVSGETLITYTADGQVILPSIVVDSTAGTEYFAAGQVVMPSLITNGVADTQYDAVGDVTFTGITISGDAAIECVADGQVTLPMITTGGVSDGDAGTTTPVTIEETPLPGDDRDGGGVDITVVDAGGNDTLLLMQGMGSDDNATAVTWTEMSINAVEAPFQSAAVKVGGPSPWFMGGHGYWLDADTPRPATGTVLLQTTGGFANEGVAFLEFANVRQDAPIGHGATPDLRVLKTSTVMATHTGVDASSGDVVALYCSCSNAGTMTKPDDIGSDVWVEQWSTNSEVYIGGSLQKGALFTLKLTDDLSNESITANLSGGTIANCLSQCLVVQAESVAAGTASGQIALPGVTITGAALVTHDADGNVILPSLTTVGAAQLEFTADGQTTLPAITVTGVAAGLLSSSASGQIDLPIISIAGVADTEYLTDGQVTLPSIETNGVAQTTYTAYGQLVLPQLTIQGVASSLNDAAGNITLPAITINGNANVEYFAIGAPIFAGIEIAGTANVTYDAIGVVDLPAITMVGVAGAAFSGNATGDALLPMISLNGVSSLTHVGVGDIFLPGLIIGGTSHGGGVEPEFAFSTPFTSAFTTTFGEQ